MHVVQPVCWTLKCCECNRWIPEDEAYHSHDTDFPVMGIQHKLLHYICEDCALNAGHPELFGEEAL